MRSALASLERDGFIVRVRGSGTYINKEAAISSQLDSGVARHTIGLILQGQDRDANASLIDGVREALAPDSVDLRIFLTDNKFANERTCLQSVIYQNFSGFIVDGVKASLMNPNLDCYQKIFRKKIPVVFYNNYYKELPYPKVVVDDHECADRLLGILAGAGHRKIAGIFVYDNHQSIEKFQGTAGAMKKYGVVFEDDYMLWCVSNEACEPRFYRTVARFLKRLPNCTAIVCCNYIIFQLVCRVLEDAGKTVPEDYSLVCFDYSKDDWEKSGITCSVHQGRLIGREVASSLMRLINSGEFQDNGHSRTLAGKIHEGRSVRRLD